MIGMDTNVFLRFLVKDDDRKQHELARQFIKGRTHDDPAFISTVTLAETVWVLRKRLRFTQRDITNALASLLGSADIVFEAHQELLQLLSNGESPRAGFADHLIVWAGQRAGCLNTVTFDKLAAKNISGMSLLK